MFRTKIAVALTSLAMTSFAQGNSPGELDEDGVGNLTDPIPTIVDISPNNVVINLNHQNAFGPITISATGFNVTSIAAGAVPAQIHDNISISGPTLGPLIMHGSGFTGADVGVYSIDFTATNAAGDSGLSSFMLTVTNIPEPATLSFLTGLSLLVLRRR